MLSVKVLSINTLNVSMLSIVSCVSLCLVSECWGLLCCVS